MPSCNNIRTPDVTSGFSVYFCYCYLENGNTVQGSNKITIFWAHSSVHLHASIAYLMANSQPTPANKFFSELLLNRN